MTLDRHALAERLRPHLSPTEPRLASELLVLAGVQTGSRVGGVVAAALQELRAAGHARPAGGTRQALRWLASAPGDLGSETLPLARLDATVTLTTTARTTAGGTKRTELAATVTLGPSWPATTPTPPRWSTALNDAQVAAGALTGARANAITRAEAQLRALRTSKTTLPLLPTEDRMTRTNPLLLPSKDREDFLAYLASVARGARQDSACAWLAKRGLARTTVEATAWLEEAVEAGVLAEHRGTASDGTVVLRYSPADPSVKPAPLPKSSAPAEEPPPAPKAPSKAAAAPVAEEDPGDPAEEPKTPPAAASPLASEPVEPVNPWLREAESLAKERNSLRHKLWEAESKIETLEEQIRDWDRRYREADQASARDLTQTQARGNQLRVELGDLRAEAEIYREAICRAVPEVRGTSPAHMAGALDMLIRNLRADYKTLYDQATARQDLAASTASWLVSLSEEGWAEVSRARAELAESRRLREQSHRLELAALEALDRVVGARPAAPQAPAAPELVPDPIPLGPPIPATPEPPASAEQANDGQGALVEGTLEERVRKVFEANPGKTFRAPQVAELVGSQASSISGVLSTLARQDWLEKPAYGQYRLARRGGYESTDKPVPKARSVKPGKAAKKPAAKAPGKPAPKAKPAPPAKKLRAPRPTKTIREAKPKILDSYPVETWAEGFYSVVGLINANGLTRGAWLLLHAKPNATVAAEVLDLLEQADLITTGDTIKLGAVLQADIDAQPGARLGYLLSKRVGEWVCELVASSAKPPTVDTLAKLTGLHRGLFCALLNALEDEGLVKRSKGGGAPVWVVPAQARTLPLIPGVDPAPASEEPCPT